MSDDDQRDDDELDAVLEHTFCGNARKLAEAGYATISLNAQLTGLEDHKLSAILQMCVIIFHQSGFTTTQIGELAETAASIYEDEYSEVGMDKKQNAPGSGSKH